jgi:protein phosphatase 2C family protein 2/3
LAAGGFIECGRVNNKLAMSRAIGNFKFKKPGSLPPEQQMVTALPDVTIHEIADDDEFLVVACDGMLFKVSSLPDVTNYLHTGIWDCRSSQAVVEFVRRGIASKQELHIICENLMDNCLARDGDMVVGSDNMTMIIIGLLHGKTKEEWYDSIAQRVADGDGPCAPPEYGIYSL